MLQSSAKVYLLMCLLALLQVCNAPSHVVATGSFVDKGGQKTSGTYQIEQSGDQLTLVLSEDFQTNEGPDLHVIFTPVETAVAENDNVMADSKALVIAPLRALSGEQRYQLQDDIDMWWALPRFLILMPCTKYCKQRNPCILAGLPTAVINCTGLASVHHQSLWEKVLKMPMPNCMGETSEKR